MRPVVPSVHLVAYTQVDREAERQMLDALGAPDDWETNAEDGERLVEVMGRLCYKSFGTELNPNVTKTREGNPEYLGNILKQKHGSVFEHSYATIGFIDVSPVVTHELVRHRAGTAFSQVSMRFVRLEEIGFYMPEAFGSDFIAQMLNSIDDETWAEMKRAHFGMFASAGRSREELAEAASRKLKKEATELIEQMERFQLRMAEVSMIDHVSSMHLKKRFTSAMRRLAPYGLATAIGVTANHRAWRHMIETRTSRAAEEEIRFAFGEVAAKLANRFPAMYQDMQGQEVEGLMEYRFDNQKV